MGLCRRGKFSRFTLGATISSLLAIFSSASFAGVIYEYREGGSPTVIGTLEVASPPASASKGWSTTAASDLSALFLDDTVFGLGSANLLYGDGTVNLSNVASVDGAEIDSGTIAIQFPTMFPVDPTRPTIDKRLSIFFDSSSVGDSINLASQYTFPGGGIVIGDLFSNGNWLAQAPEPGTLMLLLLGLLGVARVSFPILKTGHN